MARGDASSSSRAGILDRLGDQAMERVVELGHHASDPK
jgi:hypothetical protein